MSMKDKLTRAELIESLHDKVNKLYSDKTIDKKNIHYLIGEFLEELKEALLSGRSVELRGFGTFEVKVRKGRERARNPKTGDIVRVEDHGVTVFRPGKE